MQHGNYVNLLYWDATKGVLEKVYKPEDPNDWTGILWAGNATKPPTGQPACGWHEELCKKTERSKLLVPLLLLGIVVVFVSGILILLRELR